MFLSFFERHQCLFTMSFHFHFIFLQCSRNRIQILEHSLKQPFFFFFFGGGGGGVFIHKIKVFIFHGSCLVIL